MSETKFTPGPYTAGVGKSLGLKIIGVFSSPSKVLAICGEQGAEDEDESIGNTYLFSAAPDMYDALKAMKFAWLNKDEMLPQEYEVKALKMYDYAIAKAEGRNE